jgi:hypothetical protein
MAQPPTDFIERRTQTCSALIEAAEPTAIGKFIIGHSLGVPMVGGLVAGKVFEIGKAMIGGTWIGGGAYLTAEAVSFHPNTLDSIGFKNLETIRIPLEEVRAVRLAIKALHPAVAIETEEATLWLSILLKREAFAEATRAAIAARAAQTSV